MTKPPGVRVFISYAHADEALRARLRVYLRPLEREGRVLAWDDRAIQAGDQWADEIDARLEDADLVLLLVTADFMNSEYCLGKELKRALERNADPADRAIVIPVILHKCDWETSAFAHLQALPPGSSPRPLSEWKSEADYYTAVVKGLRERIESMVDPRSRWIDRARARLRDPLWWQRPRLWAGALALVLLAAAATAWWRRAAAQVETEVAQAELAMRSGRHADAIELLRSCGRWWVGSRACFARDKAKLGAQLEQLDPAGLELYAQRVEALRGQAAMDPDLLLLSAQLALYEGRPEKQAQALRDIDAAIERAGGRFPEAQFVLADRELLAGRPAAALKLLDRAIAAVDPAPAHYLNMRAYARLHSGDRAGAIADYEASATRGSILSRIELAELLWGGSDFERAGDQLQAALAALGSETTTLAGRNALPWTFPLGAGTRPVVLRQGFEKRCYAAWMAELGRTLAQRPATEPAPARANCGVQAQGIKAVVAASLGRAAQAGMDAGGRERAAAFAKQQGLPIGEPDG